VNNSTQALAADVFDAMNTGQLEWIRDLDVRHHRGATAHDVNAVSPQGVEITGKPFAMKTAHFFRSRDGRLCEHWGVRDGLDVLYQVGALTPRDFAMPEPG
jgi:hypothetical protein